MSFDDYKLLIRRCGSTDELIEYFYDHAATLSGLAGLTIPTAEFSISEWTDQGDTWSFIIWWIGDPDWPLVMEGLGCKISWKWIAPVAGHGADAFVSIAKIDWPIMAAMERFMQI
jgi:hypothetical protein